MRKIIVQEFITLDGVMQAPGGPDEDKESGFKWGGWTAPYFDGSEKDVNEFMAKWLSSMDLLLGRKTFEIFENYWPSHEEFWPGVNDVTKYCVSSNLDKSDWNNSKFLKNVDGIKEVKNSEGSDLQVIGSGNLCQTLFKEDLVDELRLMTFPITLGTGKRLFEEGTIPAAFALEESFISSKGVIFASYKRAGEVKTGTVGE